MPLTDLVMLYAAVRDRTNVETLDSHLVLHLDTTGCIAGASTVAIVSRYVTFQKPTVRWGRMLHRFGAIPAYFPTRLDYYYTLREG